MLLNTARQLGPWLTLTDGTELLMDAEEYQVQVWLKQCPTPKEKEKLFSFVVQVRKEANASRIPLDSYLEKQDYEFIDEYEINVAYSEEEISCSPFISKRI